MAETIETTDVKTLTANTTTSALTGKAVAIYDKTSGDASAYDGSTLKSQLDKADSAYQKPGTGIPKTDLASAVQTSLEKADSALQTHQDISGKADRDTDAVKDNIAKFDGNGNAIDSGINEYELAKKAAYNPTMTSGYSGGMIVPDAVGAKDEVLYRLSEKDRITQITKFEGKTLAWNQIVKDGNFSQGTTYAWPESASVSISVSNNTLMVTTTSARTGVLVGAETFISGHIYHISCSYTSTHTLEIRTGYYINNIEPTNTFKKVSSIGLCTNLLDLNIYPQESILSGTCTFQIKNLIICDLTLLFGAGNEPTTVAEFEAMFPEPYYPYNPGELISNDASAIETVGFNLWDEEWEIVGSQLKSKNLIPVFPNTAYYITMLSFSTHYHNKYYFNSAGEEIGSDTSDSQSFTTPADCAYMSFILNSGYGTTYNHDICINLSDESRNGTYEPYRKSVLPLNLDKIKVYSPNIWDEEWELGVYLQTTGEASLNTNRIRSKNFIPVLDGVAYYAKCPVQLIILSYDANKNYIGEESVRTVTNNVFTIPTNAAFIRFYTGDNLTTYNNDICINLSDPAFNGRYFPHGVLTLEGGLKGVTNGAKDEIKGGKYIKRVARINAGTRTWQYDSAYGFFYLDALPNRALNPYNMVCSKYAYHPHSTGDAGMANEPDKIITNSGLAGIWVYIKDSSYTDPSVFTTALNGVMIDFELANEEVYELVDDLPAAYPEYKGGYVKVLGDSPRMPLTAYFSYNKTTKEINNNILDLQSRSIAEGIADSISAGTAQEFVFRQSGGDGVNYMKRIKGKTLAWNQMLENTSFTNSTMYDVGREFFDIRVYGLNSGETTTRYYVINEIRSTGFYSYIFTLDSATTGLTLKHNGMQQDIPIFTNVSSVPSHKYYIGMQVNSYNPTSINGLSISGMHMHDLTLLFGSGNEPTTVAEFEALFSESYYPYCAGKLISNDAKALETVGFNLWDTSKNTTGYYNVNTGVYTTQDEYVLSDYITVIPGETYYFSKGCGAGSGGSIGSAYFDENKNWIGGVYSPESGTQYFIRTIPAGIKYMRISAYKDYYNAVNGLVCINISDSNRNGQYEPYWKRKIELGLHSFQVRNPQTGEVITVNGLKSAGSVHDEIVGNKYIKRVGSVDMGSLEWEYGEQGGKVRTQSSFFPIAAKTTITYVIGNSINAYGFIPAANPLGGNDVNLAMAYYENKLYVRNDAWAGLSGAQIKATLNGVMLYYELANEEVYELVEPIQNAILVDSGGVEKAVYPIHSDGSPSAPFNCDSNYSISIPKLLAKLNE